MIPAGRVTVIHDEPGHTEVHVARARGDQKDIVDRWLDGTWSCTCFTAMVVGKTCDHMTAAREAVTAARAS